MILAEPDLTDAAWFKSSYSDANRGDCVEVAFAPGWVGVRDTKQPGHSPTLAFTPTEWTTFLAGVRDGELIPR